jgi:hypothetical protein
LEPPSLSSLSDGVTDDRQSPGVSTSSPAAAGPVIIPRLRIRRARIMMILLSSLEKLRRRPDSASTGSGFEARLRQCRAGQRLGDLNLKGLLALALRQG